MPGLKSSGNLIESKMAITKEYFSHDYLTRSDPKVRSLMARLGCKGYGVFWCIVEILYQSDNTYPCDHAALAYELHEDEEVIRWIIEDSGLFVIENAYFSSISIARRLDKRNEVSQKKAENVRKRWEKAKENQQENIQQSNEFNTEVQEENYGSNTDVLQMNNNSNTKTYKVKGKLKEKVISNNTNTNESVPTSGTPPPQVDHKSKITRFSTPDLESVNGYMLEKAVPESLATIESEKFVDYYTSKGWKVGNAAMKDWQAAVRNWLKNVNFQQVGKFNGNTNPSGVGAGQQQAGRRVWDGQSHEAYGQLLGDNANRLKEKYGVGGTTPQNPSGADHRTGYSSDNQSNSPPFLAGSNGGSS